MSAGVPQSVLERERAFFDQEATALADDELAMPADVLARYRNARQSPFNAAKDALFARLQPLEGQRVLDYGCGNGENSCLLAACGALVTAFDLSPGSVAKARRRVEGLGLADRIHFDVRAAGDTGYPHASFDVVTGFNILHHVHWNLPSIYEEIAGLLKPQGTAYFLEPVANSGALRTLRRVTPVPRDATPDERQLLYEDFDPLRKHFARVELEHFYCLERLHRLTAGHGRRQLRWVDHHAQRLLPWLRRYYGLLLVRAAR